MTTLTEKKTSELESLKTTVAQMIHELLINGLPTAELIAFEAAIDDELDRRGY